MTTNNERLVELFRDHRGGGTTGNPNRPYKCRCGHEYTGGGNTDLAHHLAAQLAPLVRDAVECQDCNGHGHDGCDACNMTGRRSGGKCRQCVPVGSGQLECPTCYGLGMVSLSNAESMRWGSR